MHFSQWTLPALLLAEAGRTSASIMHTRLTRRQQDHEHMRRSSAHWTGDLERRSSSPSTTAAALSLDAPDTDMNATVLDACTVALSNLSAVSNTAGYAACYNILDWHPDMGVFQADLRIFQKSRATGDFADTPMNTIAVMLQYPESTQFQSLMKRSTGAPLRRQSTSDEIQQFSLLGNIKTQLDLSKLNR